MHNNEKISIKPNSFKPVNDLKCNSISFSEEFKADLSNTSSSNSIKDENIW